jgi:hypothetical protein
LGIETIPSLPETVTPPVAADVDIPGCVIAKVLDATARLPDRVILDRLISTEKETVPLVVPENPDVIVTQGTLLIADQGQFAPAVTLTVPAPPTFRNEALAGEIENVQLLPTNRNWAART